ncbi:hypothetical protein C6503_19245 [Candidatus Poribacteria bacterium]|nr:MAG: hypothetical protein C6503_19245 [Candidatus Poribacteria bacterium]
MKFKRTTITLNDKETQGYSVEGLDNSVFRGLRVVLVKEGQRWSAYEATTGHSITPSSWPGSYSNKTREGILRIVSKHLSNIPESGWTRVQEQLDYQLRGR